MILKIYTSHPTQHVLKLLDFFEKLVHAAGKRKPIKESNQRKL